MPHVIINGRLLPEENAAVPVQDRGFRYGDGVFETIAVAQGVPCYFEQHRARLAAGLSAIKIAFDVSLLEENAKQLLHANQLTDGILRIQVTRGIGSKGYLPDPSHPQAGAFWVMETSPFPIFSGELLAAWHSSYHKISPEALPVQYKLCQGLNSALARMEAQENGCFDAVLTNEAGDICETSSGNLFWLKNNVLYTPALDCGVLEGITRAHVMRLSPWPVREVKAPLAQLAQAEAVVATNVIWQAIAVNRLLPQDSGWESREAAQTLRLALEQDRQAHCLAQRGKW